MSIPKQFTMPSFPHYDWFRHPSITGDSSGAVKLSLVSTEVRQVMHPYQLTIGSKGMHAKIKQSCKTGVAQPDNTNPGVVFAYMCEGLGLPVAHIRTQSGVSFRWDKGASEEFLAYVRLAVPLLDKFRLTEPANRPMYPSSSRNDAHVLYTGQYFDEHEVRSVVYALRDRYSQLVWSKDKQEQCLELLNDHRKFLEVMIDGQVRQIKVINEIDKFRGFINKETDK